MREASRQEALRKLQATSDFEFVGQQVVIRDTKIIAAVAKIQAECQFQPEHQSPLRPVPQPVAKPAVQPARHSSL